MSNSTRVLVLSATELNTIRAAMHLFEDMCGRGFIDSDEYKDIYDIATGNDEHLRLKTSEVGRLRERIEAQPAEVFVAHHEHRHGSNIDVYASMDAARAAKDAVGKEDWDKDSMGRKPRKNIGDRYFDWMANHGGDESFNIVPCTVSP